MRAAGEFLAWCEARGVASLAQVQPLHFADWIEALGGELAPPSVKQQLAGVRRLFDWLVTRSEEHTSELQSLMRNSYAVFCLKKNNTNKLTSTTYTYAKQQS